MAVFRCDDCGKPFEVKATGFFCPECCRKRSADRLDIVEVVRCKDCKHYTPVEGGKPLCALRSIAVGQDDFCSYGERRAAE